MESRTNQSVTPDVQALMLENLKLAKRVEVLENTLSAGKEVLTLESSSSMPLTRSCLTIGAAYSATYTGVSSGG